MNASKLYNPMMIALLRSPIHRIVSGMYMLVHFTGRKSGKEYTTPVEYFFDGSTLLFFTASERVWWKNLQDGALVTVRLKGQAHKGTANTSVGAPEVFTAALQAYLQKFPGRRRMLERGFQIRTDDNGQYNAGDVAKAAQKSAVVQIELE